MGAAAKPAADDVRFRALTEALPALVFVAGPDGRTVFVNHRAVAYSSVPREEMFGDGWLELLHPEDRPSVREAWRRAIATGEPWELELRFRRHDGEYRLHACRAEPSRAENGDILEWFGACIDVEEQRRAQAALRERVDELQTLLDTLPVGVFIAHDPECRRISGNRAAADLLRLPLDANLSKSAGPEEVPMNFRILKHGKEIPTDALPVQRAARGEIVQSEEVDHEFDDGTLVQTLISARPLHDETGRPRGAVAAILDITALKSVEESDRRKATFLAELSHELRNPLAPLTTALELLRDDQRDPERVASLVDTMQRQLGYVVGLVDDLFEVARVGRGEIELHREPLDLRETVDAAVETVRPLIDERGHELVVEHADAPLSIDGDAKRLTQVVVNLLTNAAKYTEPHGTITVRTELGAKEARLRVRDTGLGIPPEHLEQIFLMFMRVPAHRDRVGGSGLGIGLALARRVVDMHGGSIEAHSEGFRRGSEFIVRLPLADAPDRRRAAAAPESRSERAVHRVLVVDDNDDAAATLRMWLEVEGHETVVVHDGPAALEAAASFAPDVVLLDIGLPSMDGYEVAARLRAMPALRDVQLIALTGWGQVEDRRRSGDAGFDAHLTKPVKGERLRKLLAARDAQTSAVRSRSSQTQRIR